MKEDWKWIKGYEGRYQISNHGRLKSFLKDENGRLRSNVNKYGWYLTVNLIDKYGKMKTKRIHRIVAETFIREIPKGYQVHHKNGNKQDNRVDNLEILSPREHCLETIRQNPHCLDGMIAYNKGRIIDDGRKRYVRSKEPKSRFKRGKILQYSLNGEFINSYSNAADAYRDTGICQRNILQVASKEPYNKKGSVRKQAGGYVWKYEKGGGLMFIRCIGSGSSGNSYALYDDSNKILLLDLGLSRKEIMKAIDFRISDVVGCLISHEHS